MSEHSEKYKDEAKFCKISKVGNLNATCRKKEIHRRDSRRDSHFLKIDWSKQIVWFS